MICGAVIYTRVSSHEQVANQSLRTQEQACLGYCRNKNLEVLKTFVEEGESAKTADRPRLKEMLLYCNSHKERVDYVVIYALSRFARKSSDHHMLRLLLVALGITLRSVTEPIDDSPAGQLMETVLSGFSQFDNDIRAEHTVKGLRAAKQQGRVTHRAPLGYRNTGKTPSLEVDPERGPLVAEAFRLAAEGSLSKTEIRRKVNALGLRTRQGNPLSKETFRYMLGNPAYIGVVLDRKNSETWPGDWQPLVDEATWDACQALMARRTNGVRTYSRSNPNFPLRRLVRCGCCGRPLTGSSPRGRTKNYPYYNCACRRRRRCKSKV